ncbi:DNA methyltransferase [Arcobacter sp. CECT 8986]|uniref:class I SAM-dependent DNA methyltransferase n=1 Tax=Arcobacter sp. CECT 8986 TaxID=2044507 RepID=UPI001009922D|nr:N-6 DNA methylase [Arcobacter sp. CECT 8986]RXJ98794.1 DNA methyltransferase [Arcobacter sp. CECT 8986]
MFVRSEVKSKIDSIWNKFWSGGIANPLDAIQQITALIFLKLLNENDNKAILQSSFTGENYVSIFENDKMAKWDNFKELDSETMLETIRDNAFPFIKKYNEGSEFNKSLKDLAFIITKPSLLSETVDGIDQIFNILEEDEEGFMDSLGDMYEYLLSEISSSGKNGQFRTPRHIIQMITSLVNPQIGEKVFDPSCGTAGFLVSAYSHMLQPYTEKGGKLGANLTDTNLWDKLSNETFYGNDSDISMIRISMMNMMLHDISNPHIKQADTLSKGYNEKDMYQVVLANPPFKGSIDKEDQNENFSITSTKTELLFLDLIERVLDIGGRCGVIIPDGVLFGSSKAHKTLRKNLLEKNELKAVISMPSGVFKPYAGVSTAVLVFVKGGTTSKVWFYDMEADGYSLDDKRNKIEQNDIPDILEQYTKKDNEDYKDTKKHFFVDIKDIKDNDYDLSINRYKTIEYEEVEYVPTEEILAEIESLSSDINKDLGELKSLI